MSAGEPHDAVAPSHDPNEVRVPAQRGPGDSDRSSAQAAASATAREPAQDAAQPAAGQGQDGGKEQGGSGVTHGSGTVLSASQAGQTAAGQEEAPQSPEIPGQSPGEQPPTGQGQGPEGQGSEGQPPQQAQGQGPEAQVSEGQELDPERPALSAEEALALAESCKREGNELFGRGLWDEAAAKYNEALDAAPESAKREQAIYFANLAACNIKTEQYAAGVQNCTEALQLDPAYQKAYMRRCEAYERLDELERALPDAKKLLELAPDSAWARAKVAALQPVVDERTEKLKTEMFSKLKDLGNTILGKFGLSTDNFKFDKDPNTGGYNIKFQR